MSHDVKQQWIELCEKAAVEQDRQKLLAFVKEISCLLESKDRRRRALTSEGAFPESQDSRARTATSRETRGN